MNTESFAPVVDLADHDVVSQLDRACRQAGFFQIVGHGVSDGVVKTMAGNAKEFFRMPLAEKMRWVSGAPEIERGYTAMGTEGFSYSMAVETPSDLVEGFTFGRDEYPSSDPVFNSTDHTHFAANIWPERPNGMRAAFMIYYSEVERVTRTLTTLLARALQLDDDFFAKRTDHSLDAMRLNYYPCRPNSAAPLPGQFGVGPHTDYGLITVMYADPGRPGLQVADSDGVWHDVIPIPEGFVVNLGDLLAQWTNDCWRSSLHRVLPTRSRGGELAERFSVPFFHVTNYDTVVECLPDFCSETDPPHYPRVIAGEHLEAKFLAGRVLEPSSAISTVGDRASALSDSQPEGGFPSQDS